MSTKDILIKVLLNTNKTNSKLKKLKEDTIPIMNKNIETIKTDMKMNAERMERTEEQTKENTEKIANLDENAVKTNDEIKQIKKDNKKTERTLADMTEAIDNKIEPDSLTITELKERIKFLEKQSSENLMLKQLKVEFDDKLSEIRADLIKMSEENPIRNTYLGQQERRTRTQSIREELEEANASSFLAAAVSQPEPTPRLSTQPINRPGSSRQINCPRNISIPQEPHPILIESTEDILKEAATNIGIGNVSDINIRNFSKRPDKMRFSKEEVWKGDKFSGARNLFVNFYLTQILKFNQNEVRFKNVRFCREAHKGILWIQSDRGFIKMMSIRASQLQNREINLIMFTPAGGYDRVKGMRDICDKIRSPDQDNIKTQIRVGRTDFEVFVKNKKNNTNARYIKFELNEIDPEGTLPPFKTKYMESDEVKDYQNAANQAIRDAEEEEKSNAEITETVHDETDEPTFTEVDNSRKRKKQDETPDKERPDKQAREKTPEMDQKVIDNIHVKIGYKEQNELSDSSTESD